MWAFLTGGLSTLLTTVASGIVGPVVTYLGKRQDTTLDGFKTAGGYDLEAYKASLDAQVRMASIRTGQVSGRLVTLAVGIVAMGIAIHWTMMELDSSFTFGTGRYGNLGVPALPKPYDAYEWELLKSLFYIGPAVPVTTAVAAWLHRR